MIPPALVSTLTRAARFFGVTIVATVTGQTILFLLFEGFNWSAAPANIVAVGFGTALSYWLSVNFVWKYASSSVRDQMIVYVALAVLGLVVSTLLAAFVSSIWTHALSANVGSILGFGLVWVLRFVVLDRTVFRMEVIERDPPRQ